VYVYDVYDARDVYDVYDARDARKPIPDDETATTAPVSLTTPAAYTTHRNAKGETA